MEGFGCFLVGNVKGDVVRLFGWDRVFEFCGDDFDGYFVDLGNLIFFFGVRFI